MKRFGNHKKEELFKYPPNIIDSKGSSKLSNNKSLLIIDNKFLIIGSEFSILKIIELESYSYTRTIEIDLIQEYIKNKDLIDQESSQLFQIINIILIEKTNEKTNLGIQLRNGYLFNLCFSFDMKEVVLNYIINTYIETFTKCVYLNDTEKDCHNKSRNKGYFIFCGNQEGEILVINKEIKSKEYSESRFYDINEDDFVYSKKINISNSYSFLDLNTNKSFLKSSITCFDVIKHSIDNNGENDDVNIKYHLVIGNEQGDLLILEKIETKIIDINKNCNNIDTNNTANSGDNYYLSTINKRKSKFSSIVLNQINIDKENILLNDRKNTNINNLIEFKAIKYFTNKDLNTSNNRKGSLNNYNNLNKDFNQENSHIISISSTSSIANNNAFRYNKNSTEIILISVCYYSTFIDILEFKTHDQNFRLNILLRISNVCSSIKPGISASCFHQINSCEFIFFIGNFDNRLKKYHLVINKDKESKNYDDTNKQVDLYFNKYFLDVKSNIETTVIGNKAINQLYIDNDCLYIINDSHLLYKISLN